MKRGDRVYGVDLDGDGSRLVVAGRDKTAAVYERSRHGVVRESYELIYEAVAKAFVYAVAITRDGRRIAYGCVDSAVRLHDVNLRRRTRPVSWEVPGHP